MGRISEFFGYLECPTDKFSNAWVNFNIHSLSITPEMTKQRREFIQQVKNFAKTVEKSPELKSPLKIHQSEREKILEQQELDLIKFEKGEITKEDFIRKWG